MSGYLQRLVNAAAGGGDAVHPRTGSIFSPRLEETPAPLRGAQDNEQAPLPPPQPRPRAASLHAEPAEPSDRAARGHRHTPLFPVASEVPAARTIAQAPPLVPASPHDMEAVVHPHARSREPHPAGGDRAADIPLRRQADETSLVFPTPRHVPESRTRAAEPRRPRSERHAGQRERQVDDIQIHIGRIEVIAVPPPAPRAAKALDRSVSLEAYLNRRDGRPR